MPSSLSSLSAPGSAAPQGTAMRSSVLGPLGIVLISGDHSRAHYAFVMATAAAATGRETIVFATNAGCRALLDDWSGLEDVGRDAAIRARGVVGLGELRDHARDLNIRLIVCETGLRAEGLHDRPLLEGVEVAGVVTFLGAVAHGDTLAL